MIVLLLVVCLLVSFVCCTLPSGEIGGNGGDIDDRLPDIVLSGLKFKFCMPGSRMCRNSASTMSIHSLSFDLGLDCGTGVSE